MNANGVVVYRDRLLRVSLVVETAGGLWIVPNSADGWKRRLPLTMTADARRDRLKPARDADLSFLGIPTEGG
jgi:hypothetical protein